MVRVKNNNIRLYIPISPLKKLLRTGSLRHLLKDNIKHVADHSFATVLLAVFIIDEYHIPLNKEKVMFLLLLHDTGETIIGDLTPFEITKAEKHSRETAAIIDIFKQHPTIKNCGMNLRTIKRLRHSLFSKWIGWKWYCRQ